MIVQIISCYWGHLFTTLYHIIKCAVETHHSAAAYGRWRVIDIVCSTPVSIAYSIDEFQSFSDNKVLSYRIVVHTKKQSFSLHGVSFSFSCYLFSSSFRMDDHGNGKASRRSQHTLTAAAAAIAIRSIFLIFVDSLHPDPISESNAPTKIKKISYCGGNFSFGPRQSSLSKLG